MDIQLKADGTNGELHITVNWKSLTKFLKALGPIITALLALMFAPEVTKIGELFGLW